MDCVLTRNRMTVTGGPALLIPSRTMITRKIGRISTFTGSNAYKENRALWWFGSAEKHHGLAGI